MGRKQGKKRTEIGESSGTGQCADYNCLPRAKSYRSKEASVGRTKLDLTLNPIKPASKRDGWGQVTEAKNLSKKCRLPFW